MKPVNFEEANTKLVAPDCADLPVFTDGSQVLSCWRMSFKERASALLLGRAWLNIRTKENTHPPVYLIVKRTAFERTK